MSAIELSKNEKDAIYIVSKVIQNPAAEVMDNGIIRSIMDKVISSDWFREADQFRLFTIDNFICNWWHYVGQWAWPLFNSSKSTGDSISKNLIQLTFPNGFGGVEYPDTDLCFTSTEPDIQPGTDVSYFVEICPKFGRNSLWPEIYQIKQWGSIDQSVIPWDITPWENFANNYRTAFAFRVNE